jgi:8-oxo-dGTP pyrophosphatase MutT (NUDIX family)
MWGDTINIQYKCEENASSKKLETIRTGVIVNGVSHDLKYIVDKSDTNWNEPEWEFPKGRRNSKEKDLDCALREFEEETGILKENITVIENIMPFEEIFLGTNRKSYKHKYFLAFMNSDLGEDSLNNYQITEVSKLEWKTFDDCLTSIRPYNLEKKELIININKTLEEYRLY